MKKLLTVAVFLALINPASAAENISAEPPLTAEQQELEQNFNEVSQEIITNMQKASRTMQQSIPLFSQHFKEIMRVFNQEMVPIIQAMEDNMRLLAADPEMAQSLQNAIPSQYSSSGSYSINPKINDLSVSANITNNDNNLKYNISRNLTATAITQSYISKFKAIEEAKAQKQTPPKLDISETIIDLDNRKLTADRFKLEEINNLVFLVYDDEANKESFIFGNISPELNLRLQTSGPDYKTTAKDFIKSLDRAKLQKAVSPNQK